jgi:hypothetical protein
MQVKERKTYAAGYAALLLGLIMVFCTAIFYLFLFDFWERFYTKVGAHLSGDYVTTGALLNKLMLHAPILIIIFICIIVFVAIVTRTDGGEVMLG